MTGLGARLKEARTAKGYSLDDLQSITKIQKRYLSGIENEDYSMMPGAFYVRAFIKQYAEAVELDADEMLALYRETAVHDQIEEETPQISQPMTRKRGLKTNSRLNEAIPKVIVALFIIVIIVVMWVLWQYGLSKKTGMDGVIEPDPKVTMDSNDSSSKPNPVIDEEEDKDTKEQVDDEKPEDDVTPDEEEVEQSLTYVNTSGEDSIYTLSDADTFQLRIETTGDSWIGVTDESRKERTPGATVLTAGQSVDLDVSDVEFVRIRVGRTNSTNIFVNDEKLEYNSNAITQNIIIEYKK